MARHRGGLKDRLKDFSSYFGINWGTPGRETWQDADDFVRLLDLPGGGRDSLNEPFRQHPVIAVAVSSIAEDAASIPWELYKVDGSGKPSDKLVEAHPILEKLKSPNPDMLGQQFLVGSYLSTLLWGEFFWYFPDADRRRMATGLPLSGDIVLLDPRRVVYRVKDGQGGWFLKVGHGKEERLDEEKLVQHKRWNPYNPKRGLSKVEAVLTELVGDFAASKWNERFFGEQNGMPAGLLKPAAVAHVDRDQRNEMLRTWNSKHGGAKRTIGLLPAGWDFQDLGVSQKDMDFKELREYSRELILGAFGVPPFIAGVLDKANYANARKQEELYWQNTIRRFLTAVQQTLNHSFLPKLGVSDLAFYPNWEEINALCEDYDAKTKTAERLWKMGIPLAVVNERLDLGLDTDRIPEAESAFLPVGILPAGMSAPEAAPKHVTREMKADQRRATWASLHRRVQGHERDFEKAVLGHLDALEDEALRRLSSKSVSKAGGEFFDEDDANENLLEATAELYAAAMAAGGESLEGVIGLSWNLDSPVARELLLKSQSRIVGLNDTLRRKLGQEMAVAFGEGKTTQESMRAVVEEVFNVTRARARTIARTEVGAAFGGARFQQMKAGGIQQHEWLADPVEESRDHHVAQDGVVVRVGSPFPNGILFPNDPDGPAAEVINCRCVALPVVER